MLPPHLPPLKVEQGAAPVPDGKHAGGVWLHLPVMVGEETGLTCLGVGDFIKGMQPTEEDISKRAVFTKEEIILSLVGPEGTGIGSTQGQCVNIQLQSPTSLDPEIDNLG